MLRANYCGELSESEIDKLAYEKYPVNCKKY